jgi:hypothetical protein
MIMYFRCLRKFEPTQNEEESNGVRERKKTHEKLWKMIKSLFYDPHMYGVNGTHIATCLELSILLLHIPSSTHSWKSGLLLTTADLAGPVFA